MPTDETQLQTVPVVVTNLPSTEVTEDIDVKIGKLYDLFSGKDYKKRLEDVEKQVKAVQNSNSLIHNLLRQYLPNLSSTLSNLSTEIKHSSSSSTIAPTSTVQENRVSSNPSLQDKEDEELRDINQSLRDTAEVLKEAVQTLRQLLDNRGSENSTKQSTLSNTEENKSSTSEYINSQEKNTIYTTGEKATNQAKKYALNTENGSNGQETISDRGAFGNAQEVIERELEKSNQTSQAEEEAASNARDIIDKFYKSYEKQHPVWDQLRKLGSDIYSVLAQGFRKIFNSWDNQATYLKEMGIGRENIIRLNDITSNTMHATEDLVGWNVSIDKAIHATNDMVSAGFSPRYMRENNRNLIMGLESAGLQLQPSTIRELGNAVFDATHVKELTQGWADLIAADTENRIDAQELSRYLASDDYKKYVSLAMENGATREQADATMQQALRQAIQWGATGKDAFSMAMTQAQATHGGGAFLNIPENLSSLIGVMQTAGTFSGDLKNFTQDFAKTVKAAYNDPELMERIKRINVGLVASNDFTMYDNIINNRSVSEGRELHIATREEQEAGRYEGMLPRMFKTIGNDWLGGISRTIGANSQFITGDATTGTNLLGSIIGAATGGLSKGLDKLVNSDDKKEEYLKQIADNTSKGQQIENNMINSLLGGAGGNAGVLGKGLSVITKFGPSLAAISAVLVDVAAIAGNFYGSYKTIANAQLEAIDSKKESRESYSKELSLQKEYTKAIKEGDEKTAKILAEQINKAKGETDEKLLNQVKTEDEEAGGWGQVATIGLSAIAAGGGLPLLLANLLTDNSFGDLIGSTFNRVTKGSIEERVSEKRQELQNEVAAYADGGVITKEQLALVGENNRPEVILPLTNPDRMASILEDIGILQRSESKTGDQAQRDFSIIDIIKKQQTDVSQIYDVLTKQGFGILSSIFSGQNTINNIVNDNFSDSLQTLISGDDTNTGINLISNPLQAITLLKEVSGNSGINKIVNNIIGKNADNFLDFDLDKIANGSMDIDSLSSLHPEVTSFLSYMDSSLNKLNKLSYRDQIRELRDNNIITQREYSNVMEQNQDKLISSLDSLNKTVQENNRLSRNSTPIPNLSSNIGRRYT